MLKSKYTFMAIPMLITLSNTYAAIHALGNHHPSFLKPTPSNFGKPLSLYFKPSIKRGILLCDQNGTSCQIAAMPLLAQGDSKIDQELDQYLSGVPSDQLLKDANGAPSVSVTRDAIKNNACYNTSITTVQIAALANRDKTLLALSNRTTTFDTIQPTQGASKPIRQLIWAMQQQFAGEHCATGLPPKQCTQPYYLHETVADVNNGAIQENCDPYIYGSCAVATAIMSGDGSKKFNDPKASSQLVGAAFRQFNPDANAISNQKLITLMQNGYAPLIAYHRYIPVLSVNKKTGVVTVTFDDKHDAGMHKIAVSGFQPDIYPIQINDVGNGQRYKVRVSANLNEIKFSANTTIGGKDQPKASIVKIDPNYVAKPFLIYEGEDQKINPTIFFIEHFDAIKLKTPAQNQAVKSTQVPQSTQ